MNKVTVYKVFTFPCGSVNIVPRIYNNSEYKTLVSFEEYRLLAEEHESLLNDFSDMCYKYNKLKEKKSFWSFSKGLISKRIRG